MWMLQARRSAVVVQAASRPLWQPGTKPPAHLDGTMPGDFGFGEPVDAADDHSNNMLTVWGRWIFPGCLNAYHTSRSFFADPLNLGVNKDALEW
jgi:hypothetical protein